MSRKSRYVPSVDTFKSHGLGTEDRTRCNSAGQISGAHTACCSTCISTTRRLVSSGSNFASEEANSTAPPRLAFSRVCRDSKSDGWYVFLFPGATSATPLFVSLDRRRVMNLQSCCGLGGLSSFSWFSIHARPRNRSSTSAVFLLCARVATCRCCQVKPPPMLRSCGA